MAQRKQVSWAQLRVGLLVIVSLIILGLMVFLMTGQGYFIRKTNLVLFVDNAGGLKRGDPVRLNGIDVGNVDDISISNEKAANRAVQVSFHVERPMMKMIRQDSQATLQVEGLLGQRFIDITRGSGAKQELADGAEVPFKAQPDFGDLMASGSTLATNANRFINTVNALTEGVEKGQGTLGKLIVDDSLYKQLNSTVKDLQTMVNYTNSGQGSLGKLVYSDDLYNQTGTAIGKLDTMLNDVQQQKGSLGKLMYSTELHDNANKLITDASAIVADAKAGKGSLGKFLTDEAMYNKATSTIDKFDAIATRVERGDGTIGKLLQKDDPLYGNINGLSLELRELLADFRKSPKKYLTIQMKIF